jgi:LPS export ABC transporter permease LptG/LPS export ABC transporter permease LptF
VLRILGRYVFREILSSALLGTVLATFVVFLKVVDPIFELLVRSNGANSRIVLELFALAIPGVLPLTVPFGVLVGILIGLGRMAGDGEITAMRAAGVSSRRVIAPVLLFASLGAGFSFYVTLRLKPWCIKRSTELINQLEKSQLNANISPRVFVENLNPNTILYVGDVREGERALWKNIFVADVTPPENRDKGMKDKAAGPMITVAEQAIAVPDLKNNRIQLSLRNFATHEMGKDMQSVDSEAPTGDQALQAAIPTQTPLRSIGMNTRALLHYARDKADWIETQIELHERFVLPLACIMLAMVGIPLGIATRKGGRSAGYVNAIAIAFFCYYLVFVSLIGIARQKKLPAVLWLPNAAFFIVGLILLARMERPGDSNWLTNLRGRIAIAFESLKNRFTAKKEKGESRTFRLLLLPQLVDTYILSSFVTYLALVLASFVCLTLVYNFFELIGDMLRNNIPLSTMFSYLFFLSPQLIYTLMPVGVLVAVLATFGVLSKNNEITAFKACGVSLYRLAIPILLLSTMLSGGLFAFDFYYVADANRKQDALRDQIKGRTTAQTYLHPERKWIMGNNSNRIFYYRFFDNSEEAIMNEASVFELDQHPFRLARQIFAKRAIWRPSIKTWVFEDGWACSYQGAICTNYLPFQVQTFKEITEEPGYFLKEAPQDKQMNFLQLDRYIQDLRQSGFEGTIKLQVRLFRKFSVPLFVLIMSMIAIPFGFLVGNRGAMTGIGISIGIGIAYMGIGPLFEKLGDVNQLPPAMAAWAPDVLFALAGMYLLLRMRS